MAIVKITNSKAIFVGKTVINDSHKEDLENLIQYNGENIEYSGEVLTFTEN
jgi:hypothetical protein